MARKKATTRQSAAATSTTQASVKRTLTNQFIQVAVSITALSLSLHVAKDVLTPLYGGVATSLYLQKASISIVLASTMFPSTWRRLSNIQDKLLSTLVCLAPPAFHYLASLTTRLNDPLFGPVIVYISVLTPITFTATDGLRVLNNNRSQTLKALSAIGASVLTSQSQKLWNFIPFTRIISPSLFLIFVGWIILIVGDTTHSDRRRKFSYKKFILPILVTVLSLSFPPARIRFLPYTTHNGLLRILSSTPSITGRIIVTDDYVHGFRFLRADHSILGGVWINPRYMQKMDQDAEFILDKEGNKLGDSIYSAFVLQEAVRLQERETPHKNALIIGLGVGIAAQAFMQHGINTSIIEIDPAVYNAARENFGLPEPAAVYLEDARGWISRKAHLSADNNTDNFDIIVHDCFSGGGVPAQLYTLEFWEDLKKSLSGDGIVAVNYAGVVGSDSSKSVYLTLKKAFGQCRVFHDLDPSVSKEKLTSDFINLVFFCSPLSSRPLTFRSAERSDYLSSYLREYILRVLPEREVHENLILGSSDKSDNEDSWILTDDRNPLGRWQDEGALDHWKVMRTVLPDYVWASY